MNLIVIDTLRYDYIAANGNPKHNDHFLFDGLMSQLKSFSWSFLAPSCLPSLACV